MKQGLRRWGAREDLSLLLALIRPSAWKENSPKLDFRLKLSEKGCEQRSERGFGRYRGAETGRTVPLRCPGRPRLTHLRDFSDSFLTEFSEVREVDILRSCGRHIDIRRTGVRGVGTPARERQASHKRSHPYVSLAPYETAPPPRSSISAPTPEPISVRVATQVASPPSGGPPVVGSGLAVAVALAVALAVAVAVAVAVGLAVAVALAVGLAVALAVAVGLAFMAPPP